MSAFECSLFQPFQIVQTEHGNVVLYTEVIQDIPQRGSCWVRPLAMLTRDTNQSPIAAVLSTVEEPKLESMQFAADLLLPSQLFRATLDTEWLSILPQFLAANSNAAPRHNSLNSIRQKLHDFVQCLCEANPDVF